MKKLFLFILMFLSQTLIAQKKNRPLNFNHPESLFNNSTEWNQIIEIGMEKNTKVTITSKSAILLLKIKDIDIAKKIENAMDLLKEVNESKTEYDAIKVIYTEINDSELEWSSPIKKTVEIKPTILKNKKFGILPNQELVILKTHKDTLVLTFMYNQEPLYDTHKSFKKRITKDEMFIKIALVLNNLNDVDSLNFNRINKEIERHLFSLERRQKSKTIKPWLQFASTSHIDTSNNSYFVNTLSGYGKNTEVSLNGNLEINLIRDRFVPEFNLNLMYRKNTNYAIGIGINQLYFWQKASEETNYKLQTMNFISGKVDFYSKNRTSNKSTNLFRGGFEIGVLTSKNTSYFNKNTCRLSAFKPISKNLLIKPQVYFNDFFKKPFPAIGIQINL